MASVFDGKVKVARRVRDPLTDKKLCPLGQLSFPVINTTVALGIAIGIDVTIVHGDQWIQIDGSLTINIMKNHNVTIYQNETYTVIGNRYLTIVQNFTEIVIGIYTSTTISARIITNVSITNTTYICPHIEVNVAPRNNSESSWFTWAWAKGLGALFKVDLLALKTEAVLQQISFIVSKFEVGVISTKCYGVETKMELAATWLQALQGWMKGIHTGIVGVEPMIGGVKLHGVGLTLKTLVLGVNQWI